MDHHKMQSSTREIGNVAENLAKAYLEKKGLTCLFEQYQKPWGEVDLIMQDKDELVFVEVRYRQNASYCEPHETVNKDKQRRLIRMAQSFQQENSWSTNFYLRIDVIGIEGSELNHKITWIPNAVEVE